MSAVLTDRSIPHPPVAAGSVANTRSNTTAAERATPDNIRPQPEDLPAITLSWRGVLVEVCGTALWVGGLLALPWLVALMLAPG